MRRKTLVALAAWVTASAALAQSNSLPSLGNSESEARWEAVGRLDIGADRFCNAALISPNVVMTSAHCLFDPETGVRLDAGSLEFSAGWRNGRASALRRVRHTVIHPDFDPDTRNANIALVELDRAIDSRMVAPMVPAEAPGAGAEIQLVGFDAALSPTVAETCALTTLEKGQITTTCATDPGVNGAIAVAMIDGSDRVVSLVSTKTEKTGATGVSLGEPLLVVQQVLLESRNTFGQTARRGTLFQSNADRKQTGAKFVKP